MSERYLGRAVTVGGAFRAVGARTVLRLCSAGMLLVVAGMLGFALWLLILVVIAQWVGFLAFLLGLGGFIAFFYAVIRLTLISQVIVIERVGVFRGLQRSWELIGGSWWRVFGIELLLGTLVGILNLIVGGVAGNVVSLLSIPGAHILGSMIQYGAQTLVLPIQYAGYALLYYDLRIRKEGFDLERMAQSLDLPATT
jgi:hypothetical protein